MTIIKCLSGLLDLIAKRKFRNNALISIAPSAKVAFRNIRLKSDIALAVGRESIVEGAILFDREGAKVSIGDNSFIGSSSIIAAENICIGNDVLIAWGCTIVDHNSHAVSWAMRGNDVRDWYHGRKDWKSVKRAPVTIQDKAWIGFNSIILPGVTIGEGSVVGAGSVVTKDVPQWTIVAGNPAQAIREIASEER